MRIVFVTALLFLGLPSVGLADAIPGDEVCGDFEHWEGHHAGECVSDCAVSPSARASSTPGLALLGVALLAASRIRRRG